MAEPVTTEQPEVLPQTQPSRSIHCAECSHFVTSPSHATSVDGAHERTFRNPGGYSFHVLCFSEAGGCEVKGRPTTDASWFEGTAWAFAFCKGCGQHLGWHYSRREGEPFFGLVAPRLTGWK